MCSWNIRHRLICAQICTFRGLSKLLISHFQVDSQFNCGIASTWCTRSLTITTKRKMILKDRKNVHPNYPMLHPIIIKYCVRFAISCVNRITKVTFLPNTNYNTCTGFPIFVGYSDLKVKLYMYTFLFCFLLQ